MLCRPQEEQGAFGAALLAGFFLGSVLFVRLGDFIGRRRVILVSTLVSTFSLLGAEWLAPTVGWLLAHIFVFGATIAPRCFLSYVLVMEMTARAHQNKYCILAMFVDAACMLALGAYFLHVKSMTGVVIGLAGIQTVLLAALWGWLPESPRFLHEKGRHEDFKAALLTIARVNGKPQALAAIEQAMDMARPA